ncbi:MAG TPA: NERD domain-containing protein [Chitinophagaceae bacterium]|nr:NERD domain-containing protein [Chitinophagaceae bacterium]
MESIIVVIIVVLLVFVILFLKSPKTKGAIGELRVKLSLGGDIPNEKYVINDLLLSYDGKSHQIDHIIIRKTGIFVIETKNYSGQIYGQDNQKEWTQVLAYGREKHRFYNPILQNKSHIYALSKIVGRKDCFVSIIVFPKANIMTYFDAYVGSISEMKRWLKQDREEILTATEIEQIYTQLIDHKNNPQLTNEQHIDKIYNLRQSIEKNICPRCGQKLLMRNGKYGSFYGCSGYPYCKFIKK